MAYFDYSELDILFQKHIEEGIGDLVFKDDPILTYLYDKKKKGFQMAIPQSKIVRFSAASGGGAYAPGDSKATLSETPLNLKEVKFDPRFYQQPICLDEVKMMNAQKAGKSGMVNYLKEETENSLNDLKDILITDLYAGDGATNTSSKKFINMTDLVDDVQAIGGVDPVAATTYDKFKSFVHRVWATVATITAANDEDGTAVTTSAAHPFEVGDSVKFDSETEIYVIKAVADNTHFTTNRAIGTAHTTSSMSRYSSPSLSEATLLAAVQSTDTLFIETIFRNAFRQTRNKAKILIVGENVDALLYSVAKKAGTYQREDPLLSELGIKNFQFMGAPVVCSLNLNTYTALGIDLDDMALEFWEEDNFRRTPFKDSTSKERFVESYLYFTGMPTLKARNNHFKITGLGNG